MHSNPSFSHLKSDDGLLRGNTNGSPTVVPPAVPSTAVSQRVLLPPGSCESASERLQFIETDHQPERARKRKRASQHPQYSARDWERHRSNIKKFYIDQDLSLEGTIEKLSSIHLL